MLEPTEARQGSALTVKASFDAPLGFIFPTLCHWTAKSLYLIRTYGIDLQIVISTERK
jgi:hypothetical protein